MDAMALAIELVKLAAAVWPELAAFFHDVKGVHPLAKRVADVLPDPGASAAAAAKLHAEG